MTGHHHHHHGHSHRGTGNKRRLAWTLGLAASYMFAELVGGWLANSLALLADAGHMFLDVAALALSFFAMWMAERPAPARQTYGYHRAEILAALVNGATLIAVSIYILVEAFARLREPPEVQGALMTGIALGGLAVNLAGLWLLHSGRDESLNVRGAWLHVLMDALGSLGAITAGVLVWAFGWYWSDAVASALIGLLIVHSSWRLLAESVAVLMESAPRGIDVDEVDRVLRETPGVAGLHDLHVWTITSGLDALSAHVTVEDGEPHSAILKRLQQSLHDRFGIDHITIQLEPLDFGKCEPPV